MLTSLHIENFRALRRLTIERLARVNLLVGVNNAGKTTALDAVELVLSKEGGSALLRQSLRREGREYDGATPIDFNHLFYGHTPGVGSMFIIEASTPNGRDKVSCAMSADASDADAPSGLALTTESNGAARQAMLSPFGKPQRSSGRTRDQAPIVFWSTDRDSFFDLGALWDEVVLTPEESKTLEAVRLIEPRIERLAFARLPSNTFYVKLSGLDGRVPLGSMGDGIKRLLALSLHLARSAGGTLLVDEVDTGLHYSVMVKMWRLLLSTAKRLDLQVLATTHSLDCILALATLCEQAPDLADEVLLHRIDPGAEQAATYTAGMLRIAAEQQMEVRGHAAQAE